MLWIYDFGLQAVEEGHSNGDQSGVHNFCNGSADESFLCH